MTQTDYINFPHSFAVEAELLVATFEIGEWVKHTGIHTHTHTQHKTKQKNWGCNLEKFLEFHCLVFLNKVCARRRGCECCPHLSLLIGCSRWHASNERVGFIVHVEECMGGNQEDMPLLSDWYWRDLIGPVFVSIMPYSTSAVKLFFSDLLFIIKPV